MSDSNVVLLIPFTPHAQSPLVPLTAHHSLTAPLECESESPQEIIQRLTHATAIVKANHFFIASDSQPDMGNEILQLLQLNHIKIVLKLCFQL